MDTSLARTVNAHQSTRATSRWQVPSIQSVILLICPAIMLACGLIAISYMSPIYSGLNGLDYDPAYQYLFNGAALMKGFSPEHIDHPGTPVQIAIALLTGLSWSIRNLFGLTSLTFPVSVVTDPEPYLRVVMTVFLMMNCAAVYWLGLVLARSSRTITAGLACQAGYFLLGELFPRIFHAAPEAMMFLAATMLMAVLVPVMFGDETCSDRKAIVAGVFLGLGTASKVTFFPLFLLALVLRRPRPIAIAVTSGILYFFVFTLPIINKLQHIFGWLARIATHQGSYGEGAAGFMDWGAVPQRASQIVSAEPVLLLAILALLFAVVFSKSRDKWTAAVMAVAIAVLVFLTLKHFAIHYLMAAVAIAPVAVVWSLSRLPHARVLLALAAALALTVGLTWIWGLVSAFSRERSLHAENEKTIAEVLARYPNPVIVRAYRSGYRPWAIQFGLYSAGKRFSKLIPGADAEDIIAYDSGARKLWRNDLGLLEWSYLDRFEKAGRVVLIVQPRTTKVEPQTARTETLLDQGFGDTVERIIVAPKAG